MKKRLRLIIAAFTLSFLTMAVLSFYALNKFGNVISYSNQVDHTNRVITQLYQIENIIKELDIKEHSYMLTKDSSYILTLFNTYQSLAPSVQTLNELISDNDSQQRKLIMLKSAILLRFDNLKNNLQFTDTSHSNAISPYYADGRRLRQECMTYIDDMLTGENKMLESRSKERLSYLELTGSTVRWLIMAFGLMTLFLFGIMITELKKRFSYQEVLQLKLADLKRSHAELEQIAFAASHDLQEPLRKIRVFSNRLLWLRKDDVDDESKETIERINYAAGRMQELIEDMVNLTSLIKEEGEKEAVDLNLVLRSVLDDLADRIKGEQATIYPEVLPEVKGYVRQLYILFKSLLDNSLKFTKEGIAPVIAIRGDRVNGDELINIDKNLVQKSFYRITISDNGIGFDNKFISKMFKIFQRLHNQESVYEGKGIGLAICQRIMVNHEGYILAHGHPEVGATFKLFFPVES